MANCIICKKELSNNPFNTKNQLQLLGGAFICRQCGAKIGITNIWNSALYTEEKAIKKYQELYSQTTDSYGSSKKVNTKVQIQTPSAHITPALEPEKTKASTDDQYESELERKIATDESFRKAYIAELRGGDTTPNPAFENLLATNSEFRKNHLAIRRSDAFIENTQCSSLPLNWREWPNCIIIENAEPWELTDSIAAFFKRTKNDKYFLTLSNLNKDKQWKILEHGGPVHEHATDIEKTVSQIHLMYLLCQEYTRNFVQKRVRNIDEYNAVDAYDPCTHQFLFVDDILLLLKSIGYYDREQFLTWFAYLIINAKKYGVYLILASNTEIKRIPELTSLQSHFSFVSSDKFHSMCSGYMNRSNHEMQSGMSGYQFEEDCAELLEKNHYSNIVVTPKSGDQGIDILAEKEGIRFAFQCKYYSSPVGNKAVQEAFSGKSFYGCHVAVVMTNNTYTESAQQLANQLGVVLWDGNHLDKMRDVE